MLPTQQPTTSDLTEGTQGALIAAGKVTGAAVFGADDARIGSIDDLMIGKHAGRVEYAVLNFGGFLGLGAKHYALPWRMLSYEPRLEGFMVRNITRERLEAAPVHDPLGERDWAKIEEYWGM